MTPRDIDHSYQAAVESIDGGAMDRFDLIKGGNVNGDYLSYSQYYQSDIPNYFTYARNAGIDTVARLLGIEGRAGAAYFKAWEGAPLRWKGTARKPIPDIWRAVGPRASLHGTKAKNVRASHPVNAMLNYAYAVLCTCRTYFLKVPFGNSRSVPAYFLLLVHEGA